MLSTPDKAIGRGRTREVLV